MKKVSFLLLLIISTFYLQGQNCIERVHKAGFEYFSIPEKNYSKDVDSIRFIVSTPVNPQNPTVIFLQGSGNLMLTSYFMDTINFNLVPPFRLQSYTNKYNFVAISKPGTPVCSEWKNERPLIDTTFPEIMTFYKMDFLDYYVSQTKQVINYLQKNVLSKETPIYLIGNSQGGRVAIKYTALYPEKIKKLVLYSGGVMDRIYGRILSLRKDADCGKISAKVAQEKINEIYAYYLHQRQYHDYFIQQPDAEIQYTLEQHYSTMTDYTYSFDLQLDNLLKINIPILCVYGTNDLGVRNDYDQLPLIFTRAYKDNLTMLPILDCNHLFVKTVIDEKTQQAVEKHVGDEVFAEIEKWLSK